MNKLVDICINDDADHENELSQAAIDVQNGLGSILDLVQELGPFLMEKEVGKRVKSCSILAGVLKKLPDSYLSTEELAHLSTFLCAKLQDHYTLQPSTLTCLVKLSSCVNLDKTDADCIVNNIFKEVHTQSCLQVERYKVFQILANIFDNHKEIIISKGRDFLCNYIQAVDGEQDPRNLLTIFQLSSDLVKNGVVLGNLTEEFFEVASCYFPIDFDPAAGKRTTITNQDLVLGLRSVIASTEAFAKFWIPLCLEKMESDVESAKLDAILTLIECLPGYSKSSLEPFLTSIWARLKQEITHVVSQEVEKNALNLLTQLVKCLSQWPVDLGHGGISDLRSFLSEVLLDCLPRLEEPIQDKYTWMSGLMLLSCSKASQLACCQITSAVAPLLLKRAKKIQSEGGASSLPAPLPLLSSGIHTVLEYLVKIMSVCSNHSFKKEQNPISVYYKDILTLFTSILTQKQSTQTKCIAVAGIASLLSANILADENLVNISDCFSLLFTSDVDKKLSNEVLSASGFFTSKHPHIAKANFLPKLFKLVPDENAASAPIDSVRKSFNALSALSTHFDVLKDVISYVIHLVEECQINENNSEFLAECLNCLQQITRNRSFGHEYVEHLSLHVALPLIKKSITAAMQLTTPGQCCNRCDSMDEFSADCISLPFIRAAAVVIRNICQKQEPGKTADLVIKLMSDLYLYKNVTAFDIASSEMSINFDPFNPHFSLLQTRTICFITSSICSFDTSVPIPHADEFMVRLIDLALQSPDQPSYVAAAKSFAGLLNKYHKSSDEIIEKVRLQCKERLQAPSSEKNNKLNGLTLLIWTTKALVLCNHQQSKHVLRDLLEFLNDSDVGEIAAAGFDIILRESDEVLNSASHAVIRMMYRQRFFLLVLPELLSGFNTTSSDNEDNATSAMTQRKRANHLTALSHLLLHIPKQVLLQEFPSLFPLLVHSLHSEDPHLLHSVLSAVYFLLQDASELMEEHIDTLLDDFLNLAQFRNDLNVRLKALQCIGASTLLSTVSILPVKAKVTRSLAQVLDDPKRDVRTEAAKARSEWYLVGV